MMTMMRGVLFIQSVRSATAIVMVLHKISGFYKKMENWKTSAVSTTDWMVEPKLCKMRDTSDTFVGRAYSN